MCMSQQLIFDLAQPLHWMPFPVQHTDLWGEDCVPLKWKTRGLFTMCLSKQPKTAASLSAWQAPSFVNWTQTHPWKWLKLKIPVLAAWDNCFPGLEWIHSSLFDRRGISAQHYLYSLWTHLHAALLHKTMWKISLKFKENRYKIATRSYS